MLAPVLQSGLGRRMFCRSAKSWPTGKVVASMRAVSIHTLMRVDGCFTAVLCAAETPHSVAHCRRQIWPSTRPTYHEAGDWRIHEIADAKAERLYRMSARGISCRQIRLLAVGKETQCAPMVAIQPQIPALTRKLAVRHTRRVLHDDAAVAQHKVTDAREAAVMHEVGLPPPFDKSWRK